MVGLFLRPQIKAILTFGKTDVAPILKTFKVEPRNPFEASVPAKNWFAH
jgi:hypothetical protein